MFTVPFKTSIENVSGLKDKLDGFNYHPDIVFNFTNSGIIYIPIFNTDVPDVKNNTRYLKLLKGNIKCILVYSIKGVDSFGVLLRDYNGVVKEVGPVKSNKKYLESVLNKLNTTNLDIFAI